MYSLDTLGVENFKNFVYSLDTLGVEYFDEIALSPTVKEIEAILCFRIFGENSKWPPFLEKSRDFFQVGPFPGFVLVWTFVRFGALIPRQVSQYRLL